MHDALGRAWQVATIQADLTMLPDRFALEYIDTDGQPQRPVAIHRAIFGSYERFIGILIEHYAGAFPTWLAPVQARVLPVSEKFMDYARSVHQALRAARLRAELDDRNEKLGYKIRDAQVRKVPYMLVVGGREAEQGTVSLRARTGEDRGAVPLDRVVAGPQRRDRLAHRRPRRGPLVITSAAFSLSQSPRGATPLSKAQEIRINEGIRVREVRVVSADGEQLGIMPIQTALDTARTQELDLVEVAPEASPPVCRIMDFGKYKYTQARRLKEARKKQTTVSVKEVKMGPKTERHDFDFKLKHVRRFLEEGHKAKVTVRFKGREMAHTELGWKMLQKMVEAVQDIAVAENNPRMEGRMLHIMLSPKASH